MATADELAALRRAINEFDNLDPYTDDYLKSLIDVLGVDLAASTVWTEKAAQYASLVNVSESGSSRSLSDLHKNALAMAERFSSVGAGASNRSYTVEIERP
jgi:Cdc6-like AAA superfamily ATPase